MKKKTFTSRLFSILLCLCMVLSILPATSLPAFAATMTGGEVLYLEPNSNWREGNARFAAYFYGDGNAWASMTEVESHPGIYKVTVPSGSWTNVIFCRMNPSDAADSWNAKWNQSGDLVYDGTNNLCKIDAGQWDCGMNVTWSVFDETVVEEPACTHESHSQDGKCTECGKPVEHTYVDGICACGAVDSTEPVSITVYCINSAKWSEVYAHAWIEGGAGTTWPGVAMTKTEDTVNGFDVYEITFDVAYDNVIFNNNAGSQTGNLEFMDGQYYDVKAATWYESLDAVPAIDPLTTDCFLVGSFNGWSTTANEFKLDAEGADTGYVSLELEAETTYEFKVVREGAWTSCATAITGTVSELVFSSDVEGNATITTTAAGTYVFGFGVNNSVLSVTYPEVEEPACTHESHSQDGKCTECGEPVEHTYVDGTCACGAVDPTEPVSITVYCINSAKWSDVYAYAWITYGAGLTWPGTAMTKTEDTVNGFDVYETTFDVAYENVIFNNNAGSQTGDLELKDGQYYDVKTETWYESLDAVPAIDPLATDCFLVGSFNDWNTTANEFKLDAEGADTGYVSLELEAETTYEFKVVREGAWLSCATAITGDASDLAFSKETPDNCTITTTAAGTYVFGFGVNNSALSVTYPEVEEPACTHESHGQDGKCTECGEPVEHTYVDGICACGSKNGIIAEDGSLFYYLNGSRYYAGLIEIDGDYYYVRSNGELVHGRSYYPTKTNGLKPAGNYDFDENGKLSAKNGLVAENGGLYYYVESRLYYAGLIEIDGALYYIRSNGQAVTGRTYWITKTNDLMPATGYAFDADGKLIVEPEAPEGFIREADGIYYYVDGKRNYGGLIQVDGNYYYVRSNGQIVTGRSYWTTKTNDLLPAGNYTFDANGVMVNPPA